MNERAEQAKSIFLEAIDKHAPEQWPAYLDKVCPGDAELRGDVEKLLHAQAEIGSFHAEPRMPVAPTVAQAGREGPGTVIGSYKLLEQIGEGGFGVVFMAEQTQPVRRRVALKILKPGMDTRQVVARFEAERQALAIMDHPNIAKVFDGGSTESSSPAAAQQPGCFGGGRPSSSPAAAQQPGCFGGGRPYFVMELVKGMPITDFCDQNHLSPRQRLELFVSVCQAVQHAHHKGIIHRDLKPSNVLVTVHDTTPVPKVIDFGIAKALGQELTDKTLFTGFAQMIGTPLYMSPEQAGQSGLDIDTRSDIYSLGALLYELLTGTTPLDKERFKRAAYDEIRRMIREEEPPRPSTRLSESKHALPSISAQRQTEPAKLTRLVRGELDWIVMKALDKDRNRRYETAASFAMDVQRYLADDPVEACPPSVIYQLQKYARKHKTALAMTSMAAALLLIGITTTSWQAIRAMDAVEDAEVKRKDAEEKGNLALISEMKAKDNERLATKHAAIAEEERVKALFGKQEADQARLEAQKNATELKWQLYASNIVSAQREWSIGDVPLVYHYLKQSRPAFRGWEHDYLYTLANQAQQVLGGRFAGKEGIFVTGVALSPDGQLLAVATAYGTVRVWDLTNGREKLSIKGHKTNVYSVAFSPDGKLLASASGDKTVRLWDMVHDQAFGCSLEGHTDEVWSVAFSPDGRLASSSKDGTVRLWNTENGDNTRTLKTGLDMRAVAFSPDGKLLASAGGKTVKLWNAVNGNEVRVLEGHSATSVAFSPNGKLLASASFVGTVIVWDVDKGQPVLTLKEAARSVAFSPDSKLLATASNPQSGPGRVILWDVANGKAKRTLTGATGYRSLAFSPDGKRLAGGGQDDTVTLWDLATQESLTIEDQVSCLAFSPDSKTLAGARTVLGNLKKIERDLNSKVWMWDAATGVKSPIITLDSPRFPFPFEADRGLAFSSEIKHLAGTSPNGKVSIWDAATGKTLRILEALAGSMALSSAGSLAFSSDGKHMAAGSHDGTVTLWDATNEKKPKSFPGHKGPVRTLAFSKGMLATASGNRSAFGRDKGIIGGEVKLWHIASGKEFVLLMGHKDGVNSVAFSRDGTLLASASQDGTVKLWDTTNGKEVQTLKGHLKSVNCVAFSPNGERLVSASDDGTVRLWEPTTGQEVLILKVTSFGTGQGGTWVAFSPDGKRLACASGSTIRIWTASKSMPDVGQK